MIGSAHLSSLPNTPRWRVNQKGLGQIWYASLVAEVPEDRCATSEGHNHYGPYLRLIMAHARTHTHTQIHQDKFNRSLTTPKHTTTSLVHPSHSPLPWVSQSRTSFVSRDYVPSPFPFLAPFLAPCPDLGPGDLGPCPYPAHSPACLCPAHGPGLCGLVDPGLCPDPFHGLSLFDLFCPLAWQRVSILQFLHRC